MIDYSIVCDDCKEELFVANQNMGLRVNGLICFFGHDLEQFLATHMRHRLRFLDEYHTPRDYKLEGVYSRKNHRVVKESVDIYAELDKMHSEDK
jgi:hypothetical protein